VRENRTHGLMREGRREPALYSTRGTVVISDPDDDHVLACAIAALADFIVSGDSDLLSLGTYRGIPIVTAVEALTQLANRH
jgi:predicted nucleic acid-binding protein